MSDESQADKLWRVAEERLKLEMIGQAPRKLPPPDQPMAVARELVAALYTGPDGTLTLRHWRGGWWQWTGPKWVELEQRAVRAGAYQFTESAEYVKSAEYVTDDDALKLWAPTRGKIANVLDALAAIVHAPEVTSMPTWLDDVGYDGADRGLRQRAARRRTAGAAVA